LIGFDGATLVNSPVLYNTYGAYIGSTASDSTYKLRLDSGAVFLGASAIGTISEGAPARTALNLSAYRDGLLINRLVDAGGYGTSAGITINDGSIVAVNPLTAYGLKIENQTIGLNNNWSIYTGNAPSWFGSNITTRLTDANNASVIYPLRVDHALSSGNAAAGMGTGIEIYGQYYNGSANISYALGSVACSLLSGGPPIYKMGISVGYAGNLSEMVTLSRGPVSYQESVSLNAFSIIAGSAASNNTISSALTYKATIGNTSAGFGAQLQCKLDNSTGSNAVASNILTKWVSASNPDSRMVLQTVTAGAADTGLSVYMHSWANSDIAPAATIDLMYADNTWAKPFGLMHVSGLAHGITAYAPTDAFGFLSMAGAGTGGLLGGLLVRGLGRQTSGIRIEGLTNDVTTLGTTPLVLMGAKANGVNIQALASTEKVFSLLNYTTECMSFNGAGSTTILGAISITSKTTVGAGGAFPGTAVSIATANVSRASITPTAGNIYYFLSLTGAVDGQVVVVYNLSGFVANIGTAGATVAANLSRSFVYDSGFGGWL
jgi:hypothetical protein